jgi:hypothetical protein
MLKLWRTVRQWWSGPDPGEGVARWAGPPHPLPGPGAGRRDGDVWRQPAWTGDTQWLPTVPRRTLAQEWRGRGAGAR